MKREKLTKIKLSNCVRNLMLNTLKLVLGKILMLMKRLGVLLKKY